MEFVEGGFTAQHFSVDLLIYDVPPDEISARLGLRARQVVFAGTPRIGSGGRYADASRHAWIWGEDDLSRPEPKILEVVDLLEPRIEILSDLRSRGASTRLSVAVFAEFDSGFDLAPSLMERIAGLGLSLSVSCYLIGDDWPD